MTVTIYHNPRCSKSRQTLGLIEQTGVSPQIIEYLHVKLTLKELQKILGLLNVDTREIMRTGDAIYLELGLDKPNLSQDQLLEAIIAHPALLQRPIVIANNRAVIGRPPENVLDIL